MELTIIAILFTNLAELDHPLDTEFISEHAEVYTRKKTKIPTVNLSIWELFIFFVQIAGH